MSAPVGIDLGTTHTVVAALDADGPRVVHDDAGEIFLPSVVAVAEDGTLLVGEAARARLDHAPEYGARCFKRDMGSDAPVAFGELRLSATELSALVLREARVRAERGLGRRVERAVITVPAYFGEPQRAATLEAARLAGLEVVRMVNEPTAAAMAYGLADADRERRLLVVDLGGGTFDVTVLEVFEGIVEVIATGGDSRLGGEDITTALMARAQADGVAPAVLRAACEDAKRILSTSHGALVPLGGGRRLSLTRSDLDAACAPFVARIRQRVVDVLRDATLAPADVDEVILAGGATRTPAVIDLVERLFGRAPTCRLDPDRVVALGAAIQAGLAGRHAAVRELVVTDVLSHSLGVETAREGGRDVLDGYFTPVLHRNTTLPVRRVERFWTMHPRQTRLMIAVYQGEHRYVRHNRCLGRFEVVDLPSAEGEDGRLAVDVAFTHTLDGLLEVEARIVATGEARAIVIDARAGHMTPAQRAAALRRLDDLKVHPRDLLPNRVLLEQALARHARLDAAGRRSLDGPLTAFEDALAREQPEAIRAAAAQLEHVLRDGRQA